MYYVKIPIYAINVSIIIAFRGHRKSNLAHFSRGSVKQSTSYYYTRQTKVRAFVNVKRNILKSALFAPVFHYKTEVGVGLFFTDGVVKEIVLLSDYLTGLK